MEVKSNNDATYSIKWTPSTAGYYTINVTMDGQPLEESYMVELCFRAYYGFIIAGAVRSNMFLCTVRTLFTFLKIRFIFLADFL